MSSSKFIIISREGGDFSMDLIFAGLVRRFGKDRVIDYPARFKHRQGKPKLVGDPEKDYGAERRSLCYVEGCEDMREYSRQEVIREIFAGNIEYVFLDETHESFQNYMEIFGLYSGMHNAVVVAGHDSFRGNPTHVIERFGPHLRAMFVDDWIDEYSQLPKTYLTNLSCNFDHLWDHENRWKYLNDKKYDLCFVGYNSHPSRKIIMDHVKSNWSHLNNYIIFEERPDEFSSFVRHDEYFKSIAQSKICINIRGASTRGRALRYYEIPYVGSCMLSLGFEAKLLYPFVNEQHCFYFTSISEFDIMVNKLLSDETTREAVATAGHVHSVQYHTIDRRMDYIFGVLDGQR